MSESKPQVSFIEPSALRERLHRGEKIVVVDVRSPEEFAVSHVNGAINIPSDQLVMKAGEIPANGSIVTVCNFWRLSNLQRRR
ncbi:rhodanese-like domain-containing protein [Zoogloea sp.]|uniref:rhodanese-like domain-containing protein n=1 Tax=Zoogloea sp. TaxID=49181 RepID=UPI0035ADFF2A